MKKKHIKGKIIGLISVVLLIVTCTLVGRNLEGYHIINNINHKDIKQFYIKAKTTGLYTFDCSSTFKNVEYNVYDRSSNLLITSDSFGQTEEGYYPFMCMLLDAGHRYEIQLSIIDNYDMGIIAINLKSIK